MSDHLSGIIDGVRAARVAFLGALADEGNWMQVPDVVDLERGWFYCRTLTVASDVIDAIQRACLEVAEQDSSEVFYESIAHGRVPFYVITFSWGYGKLNLWRVGPKTVEHWTSDLRQEQLTLEAIKDV